MTASPQASRGTARFPFSAVVGQADLRLALLLNAVHPRIGGVLVRGEKGTAKSTVVRALASLLPALDVVPDCRFNCSPARPDTHCPDGPHATAETLWRDANLVELPVGATEDRLIGSLDVERALTEGVRAYQPGLLAAAHRGVLYVDEVNLLHDHLVDVLLDAAGMGRSHVEREGVSISHAASFVLVGTMNPEEGELRPQLLDRFGLTVQVNADKEVQTRTEVVRRRLAFEADPEGFAAEWVGEDVRLAERIADARARVEHVVLPDSEVRRIAALCASFDVDGMRADLVLARTAVAHAAWRGADEVAATDVETAAKLVLPHRRRRDPFDEPGMDEEQLQQALDDAAEHAAEDSDQQHGPDSDDAGSDDAGSDEDPDDDPNGGGPGGPSGGPDDGPDDGGPDDGPGGGQAPPEDGQRPEPSSGQSETDQDNSESSGNAPEQRQAPAPTSEFRARLLEIPGMGEGAPGRRSRARSRIGRGVRASRTEGHGVHLSSTVLAAAPHQRARGRSGTGLVVRNEDVRHTVREGREGNLVLFAVDASGSMAARERMSAVSGAVLSLLRDAYQRRDKVGVISFRGAAAEVALPPTSSVDVAATRMRQLRTGGRTPLADGLLRAHKVVETERNRDAQRRPLLVLLTDGKATVPADSATAPTSSRERTRQASADALRAAGKLAERSVASVVVDCEQGMVRVGLAAQLATALGAPALRLEELSADAVAGVVRAAQQPACAA